MNCRRTNTNHSTSQTFRSSDGFTLIELVLVITILGIAATALAFSTGTVAYWKEEGVIRRLSETISFLHHQAVSDQAFYRLELDLENSRYRVGVMRPEDSTAHELAEYASQAGTISLELAAFLSPGLLGNQTMIPPPGYPSLFEPVLLPPEGEFSEIKTMRGKHLPSTHKKASVIFSPRGFSEFAVLHLTFRGEKEVTLLVNPFTGIVEIFNEYKDFEWTFGKNQRE